jgi:hypothetical protein
MVLLVGCTARPHLRDDEDLRARGHALALASAAAHGGLERWRALGGVALHIRAAGPYYPRDADYVFDPARNRGVARFRDKHGDIEWRYDGKSAVVLENGRCTGSKHRRAVVGGLLSNLLFWFGIPFKFLDAGATQRIVDNHRRPASEEPGVAADRFFVTYSGVGDTPDDWYLVTVQNETKRVDHLIYVASGFTTALEFEALFEDYVSVDGFLVAQRRRVRPKNRFWRALAPNIAYVTSSVRLHQPLEDAMFEPPEGCR